MIDDDGVLVRVRAASANPPDWAGLTGVPYVARPHFGLHRPKIATRGTDLAGIVEAVGGTVTHLQIGDEVFGSGAGAFAEYALASEATLAPKPAGLTFEQAAAAPMAGLTALQALRDVGRVRPGQKVLVTGAGGGIGTFAVQMAKAVGAHVTGVCSTAKVDLVQSLGADHAIDYTQEDFTRGDERYDFILDNVLDHSLSQLVRALNPQGMLVPNGGQFYKRWTASTGVILIKAPLLSLVVPQRIRHVSLRETRAELLALSALLTFGKVTPVIGRTYPLSQTAEALAYFGEGHAEGKVVITV
jgi:NADPH:quinone reductase-like Zn-dependent oxidoreductase